MAQQFEAPDTEEGKAPASAARSLAETTLALGDEHPLALLLAGVPLPAPAVSTVTKPEAPDETADAESQNAGWLKLARQSDELRLKLR